MSPPHRSAEKLLDASHDLLSLTARTMRLFYCCLSLLLGVLLFTENALASVLAIDYGTDWIKASLMKPGVPFDVLLNKDSKRKIQSSVAWKQNDRLFGSDAFNIVSDVHTCTSLHCVLTLALYKGWPIPLRLFLVTEVSARCTLRFQHSRVLQVHFYSRCCAHTA